MIEIHAIHGFLGLPTDWNVFPFPSLHTYDLTHPAIAPSHDGFWGWAKRFNAFAKPREGILMGYSLGGRLAIHALLEDSSKWKGGIIISSHTGYRTEKEKKDCLQMDVQWADRFERENWDQLLKSWNQKPVFAGVDFPIARKESQFSRQELGKQLRLFSRALQDDLFLSVQNFHLPILWICGELDQPFHAAAQSINFSNPLSRVEIIEKAAHRVPWEQPEKFSKLVQSFINEVSSCL